MARKTKKVSSRSALSSVRIIGGDWRGRKLAFHALPGVRPTADRIRETVFNWLQPYIVGAVCADLFAGSGAVGFEAASRGAKQVVVIDTESRIVGQLNENISLLDASDRITAKCANALAAISALPKLDIVFIDPPFDDVLMPDEIVSALLSSARLNSNGLIYLEQAKQSPMLSDFAELELLKDKTTGNVRYQLWQYKGE